jgi:hypothetical protein
MQAPAAASRPSSFETPQSLSSGAHSRDPLAAPQDEVWQKFRREDEGLFINIKSRSHLHPTATANREKAEHRRERYVCSGHLQQERSMLKPLIAATAALLVATSAFAQSDKMKSSDSSEYSSAQKTQKSTTAAAGQKMKKSKASTAKGATESAPGTTTGSAAKKTY